MPFSERHIQGPIRPNMIQAVCYTCSRIGKTLFRHRNGCEGSDEISHTVKFQADDATIQHFKKMGDHVIVHFHWKNDPIDANDRIATD